MKWVWGILVLPFYLVTWPFSIVHNACGKVIGVDQI
jgi:hypothetical protein